MTDQSWLIEEGDRIIEKKAEGQPLSDWEWLVYCLWVADYGINNAGDLAVSGDIYPPFHQQGRELAEKLQLPHCQALFQLEREPLEQAYEERFAAVCQELRGPARP